jgi:predicted transposase YdaD
MINHDRLFKELLSTFFPEFVELFLPEIAEYLEPNSIVFLSQEIFTDVTLGERYEADLVVQAKFREQESLFIIHVEHQSYSEADFNKRMFRYFARLHEKYDLPIYPVVIFSFDAPQRPEVSSYQIEVMGRKVLEFNYQVIQLNRLNWQDFAQIPNPIASALMSKMRMEAEERPQVKLISLQLLSSLGLNPAQLHLISGFIDIYLKLNPVEQVRFEEELAKIEPVQQEEVMEIVTSWMETGIEKGLQQGRQEGRREEAASMVLRLLNRRCGSLTTELQQQIENLSVEQLEELGEELLDFTGIPNLIAWLQNH